MNGILINHALKHNKLLCFSRKFTSTAVLLGNPSTGYAESHCPFDVPVGNLCGPANPTTLTLPEVESAHAVLLKRGAIYTNVFDPDVLVEAYSECGRMDHAFKVFDEMPIQNNTAIWNLLFLGCKRNFQYDDSWRVFCRMHGLGVDADAMTYINVLSACVASVKEWRGEQIHSLVMKSGFYANAYVTSVVIDFYARRCSSVDDALRVLNDVNLDNVFCWNAVVSGAVKAEDFSIALGIFKEMRRHCSLFPDAFTFSRVLTACVALEAIEFGKSIHGQVIKCGAGSDTFAGNTIVDFYARSGDLSDAIKQFELIPICIASSWAAIIHGFVQKGDLTSTIRVLKNMRKAGENVNKFTISTVIAACADPAMFSEVQQIQCWILKIGLYQDPVVQAPLINTYSRAGAIDLSEFVFAEAWDVNHVGIWANMISAYIHSENEEKAIVFFWRMLEQGVTANQFIVSSILSIIEDSKLGRQVHGHAMKMGLLSDVSVGCSIFTMYSKCHDLDESLKAFEQLERKDIVAWTSMISGFAEHGRADEAIRLFREMGHKDSLLDTKILVAVLNACSSLDSLKLGRDIHGFALRRGFTGQMTIDATLMNMYNKCGDLRSAMIVFGMMPVKDPISWSSIIAGFSQMGHVKEALNLSKEMIRSELTLDPFTISSIIGAISTSGKLEIGTPLHAHAIKVSLASCAAVGSSLVMMYSKTGSIDDCVKVFEHIKNPDLVCWTAMIESFAYHGKGKEALAAFDHMKKLGINPDAHTFVGVLSACSHAGLVDEGYYHLNSMINEYRIQPGNKHYVCVVDLLGRAGRVEEAMRFISDMPIEPDVVVWETLLSACRVHGSWEMGKLAAKKIMEVQPPEAGAYVMASNILAEAGEWEHVQEMRSLMKESGIKKAEPGWSYV